MPTAILGGQHPSIRFDTLSGSGEYEVIAAFYSEVYSQDASNVFRFYQYTDLCDPDIFTEYMEQVQEAAPVSYTHLTLPTNSLV